MAIAAVAALVGATWAWRRQRTCEGKHATHAGRRRDKRAHESEQHMHTGVMPALMLAAQKISEGVVRLII